MPYSVHKLALREKEPNSEIFLVRISSVWTEYEDLHWESPYSVQMRGSTSHKNLRILILFT